jgi:hypothetical protein
MAELDFVKYSRYPNIFQTKVVDSEKTHITFNGYATLAR